MCYAFDRMLLLRYMQQTTDIGDFQFKNEFTYTILIIYNMCWKPDLVMKEKQHLPHEINKKANCIIPPQPHFSYIHIWSLKKHQSIYLIKNALPLFNAHFLFFFWKKNIKFVLQKVIMKLHLISVVISDWQYAIIFHTNPLFQKNIRTRTKKSINHGFT
jgi:hypothetical protein